MNTTLGLDVFHQSARSFYVFPVENVLIEDIEHDEKRSYDQRPLRNQRERPLKWHAAEESQEQRWVPQGCQ